MATSTTSFVNQNWPVESVEEVAYSVYSAIDLEIFIYDMEDTYNTYKTFLDGAEGESLIDENVEYLESSSL